MSLADVSRTYSQGGFEPGTLVCAPGRDDWLPPYDHPSVMDMALPEEERSPPRPHQPTFSENTITLGAEESAKLTKAAAKENESANRAGAQSASFFGHDDVDDAMDAFDNIVSLPPGARASKPPQAPIQLKNAPAPRAEVPAPRASSAPPRGSQKSTIPPPSSQRPLHSSPTKSSSVPPGSERSVPKSPGPPSSSRTASPPSRPPAPPHSTRPLVPPPSLRPAPTHASPSARPPVPSPAPQIPRPPASTAPRFVPSAPDYASASHYPAAASAPSFPTAPAFPAPSSPPASPQFAPPPASHPVPSQPYQSAALSEPTFGTITAPPPRRNSSSTLLPLLLAIVLVLGALFGIYLFRPALFERGMNRIQALLGIQAESLAPQKAVGPPFDAQAAGEVLGQAAGQAGKCREPGGPVGKGRAQVLYAPDGTATSVAVSRPFHETSVGSCLQEMFKKTRVPTFGGDPVVVSKTFDVE